MFIVLKLDFETYRKRRLMEENSIFRKKNSYSLILLLTRCNFKHEALVFNYLSNFPFLYKE